MCVIDVFLMNIGELKPIHCHNTFYILKKQNQKVSFVIWSFKLLDLYLLCFRKMTGRLEKRKKTRYTTEEALHYILSSDED